MTLVLVIAVLVVVLLAAVRVRARWTLVDARRAADRDWATIDELLARRHDLVPSLVSTVKGYTGAEDEALERLVAARAAARAASGPAARGAAETALGDALAPVTGAGARHPQLGAAPAFVRLVDELTGLEDELQAARRRYNGSVLTYAARTRALPGRLVGARGFPPREPFPLEPPAG
ncbi:LemA family protein [Paraconexibacter antarcticus]|uniref:LemA family protein n=1 Tax=Paraconexibacter antarcticus TaxID=2949664 RepID=A0ABY5DR39_9ACTN|nr:LemA family protein [Paraconexibacter antarcticus]UTI64493.1 LemA family protein [Paraconexibacter antarcticus]